MKIRIAVAACLLAVALTPGVYGSATASWAGTITSLALSVREEGEHADRFQWGVRRLWANFAFEGLSRSDVELVVYSPGGLVLFSRTSELSGEGSQAWDVGGTAVAHALVARMDDAAATALSNARLAAEQTRGTNEYLSLVASAVGQLRSGGRLLDGLPLESSVKVKAGRLVQATDDLAGLYSRAAAIPPEQTERRRQVAQQMIEPAGRAVAEAAELRTLVSALDDLPWPKAGLGDRSAFTLMMRVDGSPARSFMFWVWDGRVFVPYAARQ